MSESVRVADRYPLLKNLFVCRKHFPPAAPIEDDWVEILADSMRDGSGQQEPIGAQVCSCNNGKLAITFHYHAAEAMSRVYKPDHVARITQTDYKNREEHILGQARNQNQRELSMKEFYTYFIEPLLEKGWTQAKIARAVGKDPSYISKSANPEKYGPEAQAKARSESFNIPSENSSLELHHVEHEFTKSLPISDSPPPLFSGEFPTPAVPSEHRTRHNEPVPSMMTSATAGTGAGRGPVGPSLAPSLPDPDPFALPRVREKIQGIQGLLVRKLLQSHASEKLGELEVLSWKIQDYVSSARRDRWNGEMAIPRQHPASIRHAKVLIGDKPYELPLVEETESGWRVLQGDQIVFVRAKYCVAILDERKVSA